jgi:hypothetical protein
MICRIWGLTRSMTCSYGCVPKGGFLTDAHAYEYLARAADISGQPAMAARFRRVAAVHDVDRLIRAGRDPMQQIADLEHDWNRATQ